MCIPVAAAGLIISAVSAGLSAAQTNAQNKTIKKGIEIESQMEAEQTKELQKQIGSKAEQERSERAAAAMRERASLRVAAGEAGVGGAGLNIMEHQASRNEAMDLGVLEANRANASRQANLDAAGAQAKRNNKLAEIPSEAAVWGQAGLQIAADYATTAGKQGSFDPRAWSMSKPAPKTPKSKTK